MLSSRIGFVLAVVVLVGSMAQWARPLSDAPKAPAQTHIENSQKAPKTKLSKRVDDVKAANYEIHYFGSKQCGYCKLWLQDEYKAWRRDPARRTARVHLAPEVKAFDVNYGIPGENFGRYHRTYERAFKRKRFAFPGFVLTSNGDIVEAGTGVGAWRRMVAKVRNEAERLERQKG